jgi:transketolase
LSQFLIDAPDSAVKETDLDKLCANALRVLAIDGVQGANSGHPGMPLGAADIAYILWMRYLKHNPSDPTWPDRDRFVLSTGHGSMLLYSLLHLTGYDLPLSELQRFRQWGSRTPGHPEYGATPGVEATTGPLGQGIAMAVGMALAERWMAATFNRPGHQIVDHFTYVIAGDGDLQEGISHEAASFAGHQGLGKLIVLHDDNRISIDGPTSLSCSDEVGERFKAYGWHVQSIDGHDHAAITAAIELARSERAHPSLLVCRTHIGYGSPNKQDTSIAHGAPLGAEEVELTRARLGWTDRTPFFVPSAVLARFQEARQSGRLAQADWETRLDAYRRAYPQLANDFSRFVAGKLPAGYGAALDKVVFETAKPLATRTASGIVLNALAGPIQNLIGGSADLTPSNNTHLTGYSDISGETPGGRYIRFGVREHAMAAILNGMTLHGGLIVYGGTFLVFSDYMRPAIRLAALMHIPTIFVFTHDSIGLGEDGPTHQPIEQLASLRTIPGLKVIRPADADETVMAWRAALMQRTGPIALALTRQTVPVIDRTTLAPATGLTRGGYILKEGRDVILIATGSEVQIALDASDLLARQGVAARVVSMPCRELFDEQPYSYQAAVLPPTIIVRVVVEAGVTSGWHKYLLGQGKVIGIDRFGASAPYEELYRHLGLTPEAVAGIALSLYRNRS